MDSRTFGAVFGWLVKPWATGNLGTGMVCTGGRTEQDLYDPPVYDGGERGKRESGGSAKQGHLALESNKDGMIAQIWRPT